MISNPCTFLFLVQRMGVVCFEHGAEASRMGVFSLLLPTAMLKSFADTQFVCFYPGSLRHKFVPHFQSSPNWHLHFRLPATQPPPIYGRNSFTCPNLPLRLVLLHLTPESYLFVDTPRFPRLHPTPPFAVSQNLPCCLPILSIPRDGKADGSAETRASALHFQIPIHRRERHL